MSWPDVFSVWLNNDLFKIQKTLFSSCSSYCIGRISDGLRGSERMNENTNLSGGVFLHAEDEKERVRSIDGYS